MKPKKSSQQLAQSTQDKMPKVNKKKSLVRKMIFVLLLLIVLGLGIFTALYFSGLLGVKEFADNNFKSIPVVGKYFEKTEDQGEDLPTIEELKQKEVELKDLQVQLTEERTQFEAEKIEWELEKSEANSTETDETNGGAVETVTSYEKNYKLLAKLYAEMKPKEAQEIIAVLDDNLIVQIFNFMKPDAVAPILGVMDPQQAARITRMMSGEYQ